MGKGRLDIIPEMADTAEAWLPRGVKVAKREQYGGAIRMEIEGPELEDGANYQIVVTEEPTRRIIELKKSPFQEPFPQADPPAAGSDLAKFDHDRDGKPGGSLKGTKRARKRA